MKKENSGSLYGKILMMTILPMAVLSIAVMLFTVHEYTQTIYQQVESELASVSNLTLAAIDGLYPGDYSLRGEEQYLLWKGDKILSGSYDTLDLIKKETGVDVTLFYYDTRILTTIRGESGGRIVGTGCNAVVLRDVYEAETPQFYEKVNVMGQDYFSYYRPVYNSDGSCVGMMFAGKPSAEVSALIRGSVIPTVMMILGIMLMAGFISVHWAGRIVLHIQMIQRFLVSMSEGKFSEELNPVVLKRNDELAKMGGALVRTQSALRNLVEKDVLTGINNRRFGNIKLAETQKSAAVSGIPFSVALGDIDFFKKINDTYGHDCGDEVLKEVSTLLRRHMAGRGFAVRWGGEEFLLVYTHHTGADAIWFVEKILEEIRALEIAYGENVIRLTMSFGIADGDVEKRADEYIKIADSRLYYAKRHGRNRLISEIPEETGDGMEKASL